MDEVGCPRCKTTKYRSPSLKLLVNVCGHSLCENCVEVVFIRGSANCPECGIVLRRNNFRLQLFEDASVEKEVDIRRKVLKDFNKKETDFATLQEYNNYLEEVESIIFNLTNGIDVKETEERIAAYKKENENLIKKNKSKLSKDEIMIEELIAEERELQALSQRQAVTEEQQSQQLRRKQRDELIDKLMISDMPADHILEMHRKEPLLPQQPEATAVTSATHFSTGISIGGSNRDVAAPTPPTQSTAEQYTYRPPQVDWLGPEPPSASDIVTSSRYLKHVRTATVGETAGGFESYIACQRALHDAFCGLYFQPTDNSVSVMESC